ncbi:probable carboxylesterase 18 [Spinacia oleracea]|uniref:Probable carboxylesterase 18 n=1 Tax=Spinacia oleracea TaxID=3562 RepID=A0A9R0INC5_SPIOL|nr:probable carboxylesterase 18 [Spinacia oleracea]
MATPTPQSLSLPFKTRVQVTLLSFVIDGVRRNNGTINRAVVKLFDRHVPPNPIPHKSVSSHDVVFDPSNNLWFRLYVPHHSAAVASLPVIVFFHGGGFSLLSAASNIYDAVCRRFSRELNVVVCSVEYGLCPEHKFPSQYNDGYAILKFLEEPQNRLGIPHWPKNADISTVFLAGDSAGGNLVHYLAVNYAKSSSSFSHLKIAGIINIQPFFGGKEPANSEIELDGMPLITRERSEWMWKAYLPEGEDWDHWAVNVSGPNAMDISGLELPPMLLFTGGFDPLKDWQKRYYEWLRRNEKDVKLVEYSNAIHAFYIFPQLPQADLLFAEIKDFINIQISKVRLR